MPIVSDILNVTSPRRLMKPGFKATWAPVGGGARNAFNRAAFTDAGTVTIGASGRCSVSARPQLLSHRSEQL
jgi:hypothetical protein